MKRLPKTKRPEVFFVSLWSCYPDAGRGNTAHKVAAQGWIALQWFNMAEDAFAAIRQWRRCFEESAESFDKVTHIEIDGPGVYLVSAVLT